MLSAMKTFLLLVTLLASANAARKPCTVEQMEGLQIVGYAFKRVFRLANYTGFIELQKFIFERLKHSDVTGGHIGYLVHLHQGFDRKLILLQYGMHGEDSDRYRTVLKEKLIYDPEPELAVIDDASVDSTEVVETKPSGFVSPVMHVENKVFASFVYDDRVYHEGGYTDIRQEYPSYFDFVSNASDLCVGIKFPVVDIAVDPPTCFNRMLNETADIEAGDDEWIVALVDGLQTTRSKSETLCYQSGELPPKYFPTSNGDVVLPNHERFCYFLKKPGMKTPCMFADGSKYLFTDVQVEPANPIGMAKMAKKVPSTTNSPVTAESAPKVSSGQTSTEDEPKTSGAAATSRLLCGISLLCFLWFL